MFTNAVLPAIAAFGVGLVSSQNTPGICSESSVAVNSQADATSLSSCTTVKGTVTIGPDAAGEIALDGPSSISGDLICADNGALTSLSSSSLTTVGGSFTMRNVTGMTSLSMPNLSSVDALDWQTLARLESVNFGNSGLTKSNSVRVSDTFLSNLNAIKVTSTKKMDINNNHRLIEWSSGLETLSDELVITANGFGLEVDFPELIWIANMTISNVSRISIPQLEVVNGSMRFDSNFFPDFSAPNMTKTQFGDISFTGNSDLTNITFPVLKTVTGGLLIANNTELDAINGFPELTTVGGAVKLRGDFDTVELPAINDVKGAFDVSSTADIEDTCTELKRLAPTTQGGNGKIQGKFTCDPLNANANDVNSDGSSSDDDDDSAAGSFGFSMPVVVSFAAFAGVAHLLL